MNRGSHEPIDELDLPKLNSGSHASDTAQFTANLRKIDWHVWVAPEKRAVSREFMRGEIECQAGKLNAPPSVR